MLNNIQIETIGRIFAALPFEISFIDSEDRIAFFNEQDNEKVFPRRIESIGHDVFERHPKHCLPEVHLIIDGMRSGERESAEYWIDKDGKFLHIRYFAVRGRGGEYLGVVEVVQDITRIKELRGEKRTP